MEVTIIILDLRRRNKQYLPMSRMQNAESQTLLLWESIVWSSLTLHPRYIPGLRMGKDIIPTKIYAYAKQNMNISIA